jgi:hypothetical protein
MGTATNIPECRKSINYEDGASGSSDSWLLVFLSVAQSGNAIMAVIFETAHILTSSKKKCTVFET